MINVIQAIFLGIVQGLTEFFPVSSSGQLVLFQNILGIDGTGAQMMAFDIMLHVGTLIALLLVFWKEFWRLFRPPFNRLIMLVAATIPAALVGALFQNQLNSFFGTGKLLPIFLLITAALLIATEIFSHRYPKGIAWGTKKAAVNSGADNGAFNGGAEAKSLRTTLWDRGWKGTDIGWNRTAIMGVAQAIAVFPGLSRSGTTIASGILSGAEREKAAKFSFFMSIPIIAGAALVSVAQGGTSGMLSVGAAPLLAGLAAAAVSGFFALKLMLRLIRKNNYKWFIGYLILISAFTLANYYGFHWF